MHGLLGTYTDYVNLRFSHIHDYLGSTIIRDSRVKNDKKTPQKNLMTLRSVGLWPPSLNFRIEDDNTV